MTLVFCPDDCGYFADFCPKVSGYSHHLRFPIVDTSVPHSPELTAAALDAIDEYISQGQTVYVHCMGGIGRTGTIVGCWLARHGHTGQAALDRLRELWRACPKSEYNRSPERREQEWYILEWKEGA